MGNKILQGNLQLIGDDINTWAQYCPRSITSSSDATGEEYEYNFPNKSGTIALERDLYKHTILFSSTANTVAAELIEVSWIGPNEFSEGTLSDQVYYAVSQPDAYDDLWRTIFTNISDPDYLSDLDWHDARFYGLIDVLNGDSIFGSENIHMNVKGWFGDKPIIAIGIGSASKRTDYFDPSYAMLYYWDCSTATIKGSVCFAIRNCSIWGFASEPLYKNLN